MQNRIRIRLMVYFYFYCLQKEKRKKIQENTRKLFCLNVSLEKNSSRIGFRMMFSESATLVLGAGWRLFSSCTYIFFSELWIGKSCCDWVVEIPAACFQIYLQHNSMLQSYCTKFNIVVFQPPCKCWHGHCRLESSLKFKIKTRIML